MGDWDVNDDAVAVKSQGTIQRRKVTLRAVLKSRS